MYRCQVSIATASLWLWNLRQADCACSDWPTSEELCQAREQGGRSETSRSPSERVFTSNRWFAYSLTSFYQFVPHNRHNFASGDTEPRSSWFRPRVSICRESFNPVLIARPDHQPGNPAWQRHCQARYFLTPRMHVDTFRVAPAVRCVCSFRTISASPSSSPA